MSFAEPNDGFKPVFKPNPGLPAGMSPLPKTAPIDFPSTSNPIPPGRGVKSPFRKSVPKPIPGSPPRNIPRPDVKPIPTTGPVGRYPVPNYGRIGRQVAWEILKPTPTSDGSPRDFDEPVTDPAPQPETENQTDLSLDNCLDRFAYGGKFNNPQGIYQIKTLELVQRLGGETDSRSYTVNLGFAIRGSHIPVVPIELTPREFVRLVSKKTYDTGENQRPYVIYKHSIQLKGLNPRTGKYWEGKKGIFVSRPVYKDSDPGPRYRNESGEYGYWEKLPSQLFTFVSTYLDYCPENPDDEVEPDSEQDYDRTQDEKMACKWKPENDADVNQLEIIEYTYQKFAYCTRRNGVIDGAQYNDERISLPVGFSEPFLQILRQHNEQLGKECTQVPRVSYWDLEVGDQVTIFTGVPLSIGQQIELPQGCAQVGVTFDASQAKQDSSLRDLKRISSSASNENSFINVAQCWLVDDAGNAIAREQIWVPSTILHIPMQYRSRICYLRLLTKSLSVEFTVFDSGSRWKLTSGEIS